MAPRTRSTPSTEEAPNPSGVPTEPTLPTTGETETLPSGQIPQPTSLDLDLAAVQETIEKLQKLKDLQAQADRLRAEVTGQTYRDFTPSPDRDHYASSAKDREIKIKNLPIFTLDYTLQKRQEWLLDLQQMFDGAPKRYHDDRT